MRSRYLSPVVLLALLLAMPFAAHAGWVQPWVGYHATLELQSDVEGMSPKASSAASFPNGYTLTSWIQVDSRVNELMFCHGISQFPPDGAVAVNLKIKKVTTRFYSGDTEMQIGRKLVTKKTGNKSCKRTSIPAGETSVYAITTFNKVKGVMPTGTGLVPFGNVQQRIVATTAADQTLSLREYEDARIQVERYAMSLR